MERVVWGMLAILITSATIGVVVVWRNSEMNSIRFQTLWLEVTNTRQEISEWQTESKQATADIRRKQEQSIQSLGGLAQNLFKLRSELMLRQETIKRQNENEKRMEQFISDLNQMRSPLNVQPGSYRSCKDQAVNVSGKYTIRVNEKSDPFEAFCDQEHNGGGWMVIQQRFNGTQNFYRNWTDYRNGFGEVDGEHWLGLERIHQFTKEHDCELLVEMKDFDDTYKYAWYNLFAIGSEAEHYKLETLGEYRGTAGNSLAYQKGYKFSTPDRDNDYAPFNCANAYRGGWWFNVCYYAFLNGPYRNVNGRDEAKITWRDAYNIWPALQFSRMLLRPLDDKPTETSVTNSNEQHDLTESSEYEYDFY